MRRSKCLLLYLLVAFRFIAVVLISLAPGIGIALWLD